MAHTDTTEGTYVQRVKVEYEVAVIGEFANVTTDVLRAAIERYIRNEVAGNGSAIIDVTASGLPGSSNFFFKGDEVRTDSRRAIALGVSDLDIEVAE